MSSSLPTTPKVTKLSASVLKAVSVLGVVTVLVRVGYVQSRSDVIHAEPRLARCC